LVAGASAPESVQGIIPVRVRGLPERLPETVGKIVEGVKQYPEVGELIDDMGIEKGESVVWVSGDPGRFERLLVSGRLPELGKAEALAGDLTRGDRFALDNQTFEVVGRLRPSVGGLHFSFVMFEQPEFSGLFSEDTAAEPGWIDPVGVKHVLDSVDELEESEVRVIGGHTRTDPRYAVATIVGLMLAAAGGAVAQYRVLVRLYYRRRSVGESGGVLDPIMQSLEAHPYLFGALNVVLYGTMFLFMLIALKYPIANLHLTGYISGEFSEGSLKHIGAAYESGNILWAAAATFVQNYFVATVLFAVVPSLMIPFFGLLRNFASFVMVGFIMSPMWLGIASGYTYHSITMVLELEAYVVATFVVVMWPVTLIKGIREERFGEEAVNGLRLVGSCMVLVGVMLVIAAVYEATTLILLS